MAQFSSDKEAQESLLALAGDVLVKNYRQQPIVMARGEGVELYDRAGSRFLDMTAGIAVCALGHSHPALRRVIADQASQLIHTSNLYFVEQQILAAQAIVERSFADRIFFCNSGAEANEAALKLARRYQATVAGQPERIKFVSTHGSFHGRTFATLAITGQEKYAAGMGPLVGPAVQVPFGDLEAVRAALEEGDACCFVVEPIQAEGGIIVPPDGYLQGVRELCDATGTVLIFDEVQTGVGRTGKWFGHEWDGVRPDVMTLAKSLGGGVPIGAIACTNEAAEGLAFREGGAVAHATTFGGNPLACAAAVCVLETIDSEGLLDNCMQAGEYLERRLGELVEKHAVCVETRGRGLLRGLALTKPAAPVVVKCREKGLLLSVAGGTVVRFAPALLVRKDHLDEALGVLDGVLAEHG